MKTSTTEPKSQDPLGISPMEEKKAHDDLDPDFPVEGTGGPSDGGGQGHIGTPPPAQTY